MKKTIKVEGINVDIIDFEYAKYFYPCFNGDSEFKVSKEGFNQLRKYLRTIIHFQKLIHELRFI